MAKKRVSEHMERHMERIKLMDERFKKRIEEHYVQVKAFRSQYGNRRIMFFTTLLLIFLIVLFAHRLGIIYIPEPFVRGLEVALSILIVFTISSIIVRLAETRFFSFFENEIEIEKRLFYTKLFTFVVYLSAFLFVLYKLGITVSNLTLIAGLITTAFALSMRDVLGSYMAWMVLLFKRPFRIGDFIKIGEDEGQVEHIGTFFVTIDDGTDNPLRSVKVPTQTFLSKTVVTYGTGDVPDTIKIRLHSLPENVEKRLDDISAAVKGVTNYSHPEVAFETEAEFIMLIIHYETPFVQRKLVKTRVLAKVIEIVSDVRKVTK
jgi:MscS family membrane protein